MSWLYVDATDANRYAIGLLGDTAPRIWQGNAKSHAVLPAIASRIGASALRRVDGICVVAGPGSFTSTRTGVLIADLLARAFQKPLVGVTAEQTGDLSDLGRRLAAGKLPSTRYVAPVYSSEPNITVPKKKLKLGSRS